MYDTPILIILFNPETSFQVFNCVRGQKPKNLFLFSDGPRADVPQDCENVQKVRDFVRKIDWDCDCRTNFRSENLGPALGVSSAINWFFEQVDEGIVLEHDVLVHPDFFPYCSELLERYREDERVVVIHGSNNTETAYGEASYYFSRRRMIGWGFATWRRAWKGYDVYLDHYDLPSFKRSLKECGMGWNDRCFQTDHFRLMKQRKANTWDWQMEFNFWRQRGLAVRPNVNMVRNIGFRPDAYNFKYGNFDTRLADIPIHPILPLRHPVKVEVTAGADSIYTPELIVTLPVIHKPVKVRKNLLWWCWRWFRRNFVVKAKFGRI